MSNNIQSEEGRFYIEEDGQMLAEITYSRPEHQQLLIDHTYVSESLRGQSVGEQLVLRVVEQARQENNKIVPVCSYAKHQFEKHPEYTDVLK